jgi:hypothetical protein
LLVVLAIGLLLQACAATAPPSMAIDPSAVPRCSLTGNPRDCHVQVKVTATASSCTVSILPDQKSIRFTRKDSDRGRFIYWVLDGPAGYTFRADGIFIPGNGGDFDKFKLSSDGLTYRVRNKHTRPGDYKYSINVINEDAGVEGIQCELDPFIYNE